MRNFVKIRVWTWSSHFVHWDTLYTLKIFFTRSSQVRRIYSFTIYSEKDREKKNGYYDLENVTFNLSHSLSFRRFFFFRMQVRTYNRRGTYSLCVVIRQVLDAVEYSWRYFATRLSWARAFSFLKIRTGTVHHSSETVKKKRKIRSRENNAKYERRMYANGYRAARFKRGHFDGLILMLENTKA